MRGFRGEGLGLGVVEVGYCPPVQEQSIIGLILRALCVHIMSMTQLLLSGGSIQPESNVGALLIRTGFWGL